MAGDDLLRVEEEILHASSGLTESQLTGGTSGGCQHSCYLGNKDDPSMLYYVHSTMKRTLILYTIHCKNKMVILTQSVLPQLHV